MLDRRSEQRTRILTKKGTMMRRVMVNAFGGPEQLVVQSTPEPLRPGRGQILVSVEAAA
jgi:hypothetical protein